MGGAIYSPAFFVREGGGIRMACSFGIYLEREILTSLTSKSRKNTIFVERKNFRYETT